MHALLTVIISWLAINFDLPATDVQPEIFFVSPQEMTTLRAERAADGRSEVSVTGIGEVFALYDDTTGTIFLPQDWNAEDAAATSLLVHEMVHHLQKVACLQFSCVGEREKSAYAAQRAWLDLFDLSLEEEFSLDAMTILVRTNCGI